MDERIDTYFGIVFNLEEGKKHKPMDSMRNSATSITFCFRKSEIAM